MKNKTPANTLNKKQRKQDVLAAIQAKDVWLSSTDINKATGISMNSIQTYLLELYKQNLVIRRRRVPYRGTMYEYFGYLGEKPQEKPRDDRITVNKFGARGIVARPWGKDNGIRVGTYYPQRGW